MKIYVRTDEGIFTTKFYKGIITASAIYVESEEGYRKVWER